MKTRFAFAGFRHGHILDLLTGVEERTDTEVVACCEEDATAREELAAKGRVKITHHDFATMLREVECDVVAVGDYYAKRGSIVLAALQAGKHVLGDKPLCTTLAEQEEIERLAAEKGLVVGLQLDSRGYAAMRTLRTIIRSGEIGDVVAMRIDGQHPLIPGIRPGWYFEEGKHGGTINDIGIHAFDFVPWLTGVDWKEITAARCWNGKAKNAPHFQDCAQFMATLQNGAGIMADFSYLAPDALGYTLPHYWHMVVHGTKGLAETNLFAKEVTVIKDDSKEPEIRPAGENRTRGYIEDYLQELRGNQPEDLTSADCLKASRLALEAQAQSIG